VRGLEAKRKQFNGFLAGLLGGRTSRRRAHENGNAAGKSGNDGRHGTVISKLKRGNFEGAPKYKIRVQKGPSIMERCPPNKA